MQRLVIEKQPESKRGKGKTKVFSGMMLGYMTADFLWDGGGKENTVRPLFLALAGSEPSLRPLVANLQSGKRAYAEDVKERGLWNSRRNHQWFEILKSAGYVYHWQRGETSTVTIYQHRMFLADPGLIDPEQCQFVVLTPQWWSTQQHRKLLDSQEDVEWVMNHARRLELTETNNVLDAPPFTPAELLATVPQAVRFAHFLDKRTRRPLLSDMAFCLQVYLSALSSGIASFSYGSGEKWGRARWSSQFREKGMEHLGFLPGVAMNCSQNQVDMFLSDQVRLYRAVSG